MKARKDNFEEKKIRQNLLQGSTFSAFGKGQKSTSKQMKQRRYSIKDLNVQILCYF